ncbi:hypothetical protein PF005_g22195 [Phytophthora fragariae]|uniref:Uncharacterized protein n=1 Tax=Phytophthora fragariae TaxID=53985 RepID=A0A6A3DZ33_9STRA|nr:hypothetical protein PF003_g18711 [Phytophthora fragariae]KAE8926924.1 hypothetical protein PF009_g22899 [Phytophthora fragariae]KAE8984200.1 hypothetical protein PF011_g20870 [Phytophthora fragariae]KAE9080730.1 hypothetical protein PF007_g22931 [Phytophthora fragariae]KAE9082042.1 hypothetical protein PF010_g21754 [Phytophthora fragariae]
MLMTETYTPPAALGTAAANSAVEADADAFNERLRLKIQPSPPKFPYRDDPFELTVYLVDPADHLKSGITVPLNVELYAAEKMMPVEKDILHIDPSTKPVMNGDGICKLRMSISECSMALGNRKFVLHISAATTKETINLSVTPAVTTEMTVIQHRLLIQEKLPELWYKDEGGRDKCMTLPIFLVNAKNERVGNRPVPLRVTLLYESEHPVLKQDILKMSPDCQRTIDSTGKAVLKLRIEDVSKNHQGQAFRLKVEADTAQSPLNFDVAYDLSSSISVRSKRNKRRPGKSAPAQITHHIIAGASTPMSTTSSPASNAEHEMMLAGAFGTAAFTADDRRKRMRTGGGSASPGTPRVGGSPQAGNSLTGAMESILTWTGGVVNGLHQLEWQTVGYESKSDGTADPERPIYRCPACWRYKDVMTYETAQHDTKCLIANLLLTYATDTMGHLDFVLKGIERFPAMIASAQAAAQKAAAKPMGQMQNQNAGTPSLVSPQNAGIMGVNPLTDDTMSSAMMMNSSMGSTATSNHFSMTNSSSAMTTAASGLTGMEGPPGLFRNNSGGLSEFMRSLDDQDSNDPMFYQNLAASGNSSAGGNQIADAIEMQVFYVVARMVTLNSSNAIGFPAFDMNMNLLGFYQEGRENATTEVVFVPVSDIPAISQGEIMETQRLLQGELKGNSPAVHTLARCNNDLVKLKEDVILFHWNAKDRITPKW